MASSKNSQQSEMALYPGLKFEIPKALADFLRTSKWTPPSESKDLVVYDPRGTRFVEYCAGVYEMGIKERVNVGCIMEKLKKSDSVLEALNRSVRAVMSDLEEEEEEEPSEEEMLVESPKRTVNSEDSEYLFGMEDTSGTPEPPRNFANMEQALKALEDLRHTGTFQEPGQKSDESACQIVESASTAKKGTPRPTPSRRQPVRVGKRKAEVVVKKEDAPRSSVKRIKKAKVGGKEILLEMDCSEEFFRNEELMEVYELLQAQGWDQLCKDQEQVCPDAVYEFYDGLKLIEGTIPAIETVVRRTKVRISSLELASILDVPHSGYDMFNKGSTWPEEAGSKGELVTRICGLDTLPKGSLSTKFMEPKIKILHKFLISNFIQRGTKVSYCQQDDLIILDKLLQKQKINLPKLILYQMNHMKRLSQLGYSRVIKRILETYELYDHSPESEELVVKAFDPDHFRKMSLIKTPELGWIRTSIVKDSEIAEHETEEPEDFPEQNTADRLAIVERGMSELRKELKGLKKEVVELRALVESLCSP